MHMFDRVFFSNSATRMRYYFRVNRFSLSYAINFFLNNFFSGFMLKISGLQGQFEKYGDKVSSLWIWNTVTKSKHLRRPARTRFKGVLY